MHWIYSFVIFKRTLKNNYSHFNCLKPSLLIDRYTREIWIHKCCARKTYLRWINNIRKKYYVQLKITVTRLSAQAQLFDVIMTIQIQWGYSPRWPRPPRPAPAASWPPCWTPAIWSGSSRWRGGWWRPGPSASSPGSVASLCCRPATTTSPSSNQT